VGWGDLGVGRRIKLLVIACNPATAAAIDALRAHVGVPVIGVVEPGARAAVHATRNGRVGVIATEAVIGSGAYTRALRAHNPGLELFTRPCPLFVPLAEEGWTEGPVARTVAETYLASLARSGIDTLILGCTHYPLLKPLIAEVMGPAVARAGPRRGDAPERAAPLQGRGARGRRGARRGSRLG